MSRVRISVARAAVSYSSRHRVFSRSPTSRRHRAAICSRVSARLWSRAILGRAQLAVGSVASQPRARHHPRAERSAARCRARVAGASVAKAAVNAASSVPAPAGVSSAVTEAPVGPSANRGSQ